MRLPYTSCIRERSMPLMALTLRNVRPLGSSPTVHSRDSEKRYSLVSPYSRGRDGWLSSMGHRWHHMTLGRPTRQGRGLLSHDGDTAAATHTIRYRMSN